MGDEELNIDIEERYKLCTKCLEKEYKPGGSHCLMVIKKRIELADGTTKWLNPFYIEKHARLVQPLKDDVCTNCKFKEEHEMREFVSNL